MTFWAQDFVGPLQLSDLSQNDLNFMHAAGQALGFDPRNMVHATHDEASAALGSGVYHGNHDGSLKDASWQDFLRTINPTVIQLVQDFVASPAYKRGTFAAKGFFDYPGPYASMRKLMV